MTLPQILSCIVLISIGAATAAQTPIARPEIIGADVSFLRQMEQSGVVFKDGETPKFGLQILRDHGYNWVRLRLFCDPDTLPNNLAYTLATAKDAKALGFKLLLDLHYADDWAAPAHQPTPKAWKTLTHSELQAAVFAYTRDTIHAFRAAGVMPEMVQVGNEVTSGFLWPDGRLPDHWDRFAGLISAGIQGIDAGRGDAPRPKIMIHIDQGGNQETTQWFFDKSEEPRRLVRHHWAVLLPMVAGQSRRPAAQPSVYGKDLSEGHHCRRNGVRLEFGRGVR